VRHGTTTLFAALDVLNGNVIGECKAARKESGGLPGVSEKIRPTEREGEGAA
jgi:hypothetical protein